MSRPPGSNNQQVRSDFTREHIVDQETRSEIKLFCYRYGLKITTYYEMLSLGAPTNNDHANKTAAVSYAQFAGAMSGLRMSAEQINTIAMSVVYARGEAERLGMKPLYDDLPEKLRSALLLHEEDPDIITPHELSTLRSILKKVSERIK